jgi:two-component system phosphate regulon sensor histidine kinase PhoR
VVQLRRAQLILILAALVPSILMSVAGIVLLAIGGSSAVTVTIGILLVILATSAITGYFLGAMFVGRGASLARVQNDLVSSVSHELRTPLTSIRLFLDSLRDGRLSAEETRHVITLLGNEVERLDKLIQRVLELSRLEAGRHPFERTRLEVAELVRDAIAAFDAATLGRPTRVEVDVEPELAMIGDRATLVRAVSNLLINAWKYTGDDKRILVQARGHGRHLELVVADNGIGISPAERHDILGEFSRGQGAIDRGIPGSGLGLAFVRVVVRAHRGRIVVESTPGEGSTFRLRLPRGRLEATGAPAAAEAPAR